LRRYLACLGAETLSTAVIVWRDIGASAGSGAAHATAASRLANFSVIAAGHRPQVVTALQLFVLQPGLIDSCRDTPWQSAAAGFPGESVRMQHLESCPQRARSHSEQADSAGAS
jgi:hypothetical protein